MPFTQPGSRTRPLLISSGKGGVGKSQRHHQPRRRPRRTRPLRRRGRRRHLRLLDPPHARRRPRAGRHRRDAAAARGVGRALHLHRLLRARGPGGRCGAGRCCTRRSSSSSPTSTGTTPTSCSSTCRRAPATSPSRSASTCPAARSTSSRRRRRPPRRWPACRRRWRPRSTCRCAASSRTCRGSPATTASATSCSAPAAAHELAAELDVPLLAQLPLVPALRAAATTAGRSPPSTPTARPGAAFHALAERVAVDLRPKKVFSEASLVVSHALQRAAHRPQATRC